MRSNSFYALTLKMIGLITAMVLACRLTKDIAMGVIALVGMVFALMNQRGKALVVYLLFPFFGIFNPLILPHAEYYSMFSRLGTLGMTAALVIAAFRSSGKETVPLGGLYVFLGVAAVSSAQGWFPMISYLKLVNFLVFISGIYIGTRNLHHRPGDIRLLRAVLFALAVILVLGSLATLPFPAVAYITSLSYYIREGGLAYAEAMFESNETAKISLFAGITCQSQFLAPLLVCINGWLLCDMLLVERRAEKLHLLLLLVCLILIYMTRSRVGLFGYGMSLVFVYLIILPKAALSHSVRRRMSTTMVALTLLLLSGTVVAELQSQTVSRWLRKTDDVAADSRTLKQALTESREGTIDLCWGEFTRSPLLGSGFQVIEEHRNAYAAGEISLFTAPIEKGLLPLMVLGETGVMGCSVFFVFLLTFIHACLRKRYVATLALFGCLLVTNMGEASFFAPSGGGGVLWMLTVVGGFLIDMTGVLERKNGMFVVPSAIGASRSDVV